MVNKSTPAFPVVQQTFSDIVVPGLSKREYFAAYAMMALISRTSAYSAEDLATRAYEYADAMELQGNKK